MKTIRYFAIAVDVELTADGRDYTPGTEQILDGFVAALDRVCHEHGARMVAVDSGNRIDPDL